MLSATSKYLGPARLHVMLRCRDCLVAMTAVVRWCLMKACPELSLDFDRKIKSWEGPHSKCCQPALVRKVALPNGYSSVQSEVGQWHCRLWRSISRSIVYKVDLQFFCFFLSPIDWYGTRVTQRASTLLGLKWLGPSDGHVVTKCLLICYGTLMV